MIWSTGTMHRAPTQPGLVRYLWRGVVAWILGRDREMERLRARVRDLESQGARLRRYLDTYAEGVGLDLRRLPSEPADRLHAILQAIGGVGGSEPGADPGATLPPAPAPAPPSPRRAPRPLPLPARLVAGGPDLHLQPNL